MTSHETPRRPIDARPDLTATPWDDVDPREVLPGVVRRIGLHPAAIPGCDPTVAIMVTTEDGQTVVATATAGEFINALGNALAPYHTTGGQT